jgi:hypothetical protein
VWIDLTSVRSSLSPTPNSHSQRTANEIQNPVIAKKTLVQVKSIGDKRKLCREVSDNQKEAGRLVLINTVADRRDAYPRVRKTFLFLAVA